MNNYAIFPLSAAILNILLVFFILKQGGNKKLNRSFAMLCISISIWNFGYLLLYISNSRDFALFSRQINFLGAVFAPSTFLYFVLILTNNITKRTSIISFSAFSFSVILFLANFRGFTTYDVIQYSWGYLPKAGKTGFIFTSLFLIYVLYAHFLLFGSLKKSSGVKHNQLKYVLFAAIVGFGGGITNFLVVHGGYKIAMYPIGNASALLWQGIIAYAIYKHHLMDINVVIKRGAVYAILSLGILFPSGLLIFFAQWYFFGLTNSFFSLLTFSTLVLASLVILKVKPDIEEYIERKLFRGKFEYKKALRELTEIIVSFLDEKELFKKAGTIFTKDLGAEKVSFFMLDKEKRAYTLRTSQSVPGSKVLKEISRDDPFFKWLKEKSGTVVKEELEQLGDDDTIKPIVSRLQSLEAEVCIPFLARDDLIGFINLGNKRSGAMYSHEDLELLEHVGTQASVALENARLYQEMERTQILMRRSDRLSSLGSLTANLAHELRNPMATIKTFLDLFPERYKDKEFRSDFLKLTNSEVDRINALVTELLNFARPTPPEFRKEDVNAVIDETLNLVAVEAKKRDITVDTNLQTVLPLARLDKNQIKQVLLNIFLNAVEAISAHGTITVTSRSIRKKDTAYVQVEITDTGKGIAKKQLDSIFDPFFTTKEKGVGLGLSISHQIIQEHHGILEVASKPKKGTTFSISIPSAD
ncbi:MAG: GAF domain-containing protein [Deltaproteobacteria bacterium]|nr:GAF domain-containing protein [Deltaproteobacteria bacterium]